MGAVLSIAVVNQATRLSALEARLATEACNTQLRLHVAPAWRKQPLKVEFCGLGHEPPGAYVISFFDDGDQAGVLGWHSENPDGQVYGRVFAAPVLDHGGTPLRGPLSVASVLSHEVIEAFIDPTINLWGAQGPTLYALEAGDPVEGDSYDIAVGKNNVSVSNFAHPAWWDPTPPPGATFDHLGKLTAPFTMTPGGYVVYQHAGKAQQKFGDHYPQWKRAEKEHPAARTARRLAALR